MVSAAALLADLDAAGATVALDGDRLRLRAPRGVLTDALRVRVEAHRAGIVAALTMPAERMIVHEGFPAGSWPAHLIPPGVCLDCGGPCPADGMHWCGGCRATIANGGTTP